MTFATLGFVVHAGLALVAVGGVSVAWYSYALHPWERINRESRVPVRERTVELTRLGVSIGFAAFAPVAVGGWVYYAGTMARLRATAGVETVPPTLPERVAMALPGELLVAAGFVAATLAIGGPFALGLWDVGLALAGRREV